MPNLKSLTLSYNDISDISGLKELLTLQFLDLSFNKQLESFSNINLLPSLVILNFHESGIKELQDIKSLLPFKKLSELNLSNTPLETEVPDLKSEVVMILLRKFVWWRGVGEEEEKEEITDDDLNAADEALKQRAEEEAERKRQEEEAERMREEEEENERLRLEEERKAQEGNEDQAAADPSED